MQVRKVSGRDYHATVLCELFFEKGSITKQHKSRCTLTNVMVSIIAFISNCSEGVVK